MYCSKCKVERSENYQFCFECGSRLISDHHRENFWAIVNFISQGESEPHLKQLKNFVEENPKLPYAHKLLGNALFHKGRLVEAESHYRMAIDLYPGNVTFIYDLSIALYYQSRVTEALTYLKKVLELEPKHSAAHYRIGLTYYHFGEFDKAVEHLKECAELTPNYEMAHYHLGVVYAKMGKDREAMKEFGHPLDKDLKDSAARNHLNELFAKREGRKLLQSFD